ncbi:hypothetical protein [Pseudonocardia acidicola]|uniref:Uncharacterized protein n=1 Tax=Pseudonocardia acidicola TaxID=2724939 RepID=A0ABX1SEB1_9PSEU|nr:hypothetical protein [Pseudonocardia acidicola]NMH99909.1 hypothetical protein [Pseudonocardia acidicola]
MSPHHRSHGQSFLDLLAHRLRTGGFSLMDEPEALRTVRYDDALPVRTTRVFLDDPERTLRHLLGPAGRFS